MPWLEEIPYVKNCFCCLPQRAGNILIGVTGVVVYLSLFAVYLFRCFSDGGRLLPVSFHQWIVMTHESYRFQSRSGEKLVCRVLRYWNTFDAVASSSDFKSKLCFSPYRNGRYQLYFITEKFHHPGSAFVGSIVCLYGCLCFSVLLFLYGLQICSHCSHLLHLQHVPLVVSYELLSRINW